MYRNSLPTMHYVTSQQTVGNLIVRVYFTVYLTTLSVVLTANRQVIATIRKDKEESALDLM